MFSPKSVLFCPFLAAVLVALASTRTLGKNGFGDDVAQSIDNWDAPAQVVNGVEEDLAEDEAPAQEDLFEVEVFKPLVLPAQMRDPPPSEDSDSSSTMSEGQNSTLAVYDSSEELDNLPIPEEAGSAPLTTTAPVSPPSSEEPLRMSPREEADNGRHTTIMEEYEDYYSVTDTSTSTTSTEVPTTEDSTTSAPPTPSRGSPTIALGEEEVADFRIPNESASSPSTPAQDLHFWLEVFRVARWPILILLVIVLVGVWILGGCAILVFGKPCLETGLPLASKSCQTNPGSPVSSSTFYARIPTSDPSASASTAPPISTTATASTAHIPAAASESSVVVPKSLSLLARRRQSLKLPVGSLHSLMSEKSKKQGEDLPRAESSMELDSLNLFAAFSKLAMAKKAPEAGKADSDPKESSEKKGEKEKPKK